MAVPGDLGLRTYVEAGAIARAPGPYSYQLVRQFSVQGGSERLASYAFNNHGEVVYHTWQLLNPNNDFRYRVYLFDGATTSTLLDVTRQNNAAGVVPSARIGLSDTGLVAVLGTNHHGDGTSNYGILYLRDGAAPQFVPLAATGCGTAVFQSSFHPNAAEQIAIGHYSPRDLGLLSQLGCVQDGIGNVGPGVGGPTSNDQGKAAWVGSSNPSAPGADVVIFDSTRPGPTQTSRGFNPSIAARKEWPALPAKWPCPATTGSKLRALPHFASL